MTLFPKPLQEHIQATIEEVLFRSADGQFNVIRAVTEPESKTIVAVGDLGSVAVGETLSMHGRWEVHSQYGERFRVLVFTPITPTSQNGIARYLGSGLIPGVGPELAKRLVKAFGDETLEVICGQSGRLREVDGIGARRAKAISNAVRARQQEAQTLSFLHGVGLGPGQSRRVFQRYGFEASRILRDDPYLVAEEVSGIGFKIADRIAFAEGYAKDDPRRAAGAALYLVGRAADEGHVYTVQTDLIAAAKALDVPEARVSEALTVLEKRKLLVIEDEAVYAPSLYAAEVRVGKALAELARPRYTPRGLDKILAEAAQQHYVPAQLQAVKASLESGLLVLTGGPGTGKTTTVRAIVKAHQSLERRVLLCAPTGRAAKRLNEATGEEAKTIHRLLEFNPATFQFSRNAGLPLEADLVLVDEASMLDVVLAEKLLAAIPRSASLVLVGDVDQLPPVSAGPVLRELLASEICPVVRLTEVFRQASQSAIVRGAHAILASELPTPTPSGARESGDLFVIRANEPDAISARLMQALDRAEQVYGFDPKRDVQIVTAMHKGPLGTEKLNRFLQEKLNPPTAPAKAGEGFRPGDKVMQLRNDYQREVFNGDVGEIKRIEAGVVFANMGGHEVAYERDAQEAISLAYASTIHKVQGSEFPAVIAIFHMTQYPLLSRSLLYTALTRARKLVVLLGEERAMRRAITNATVHLSNCRLADRLRSHRLSS
jgi:exodeoxyribonuclease V alpha subunit